MSLTRKMLKAMGIEEEKIDQIIEAHSEVVDGLKAEAEKNAKAAKDLPEIQKQLEQAQADLEAEKKDSYKVKYDAVKEEFEKFKKGVTEKETHSAKENAYRELLKNAGISEKRIDAVLKVSNVDGIELEDGKIKDADKLNETIKTEWADFIVNTQQRGANPANPPANDGKTYSMADIRQMSADEINKNWESIKTSLNQKGN